MNSASPHNLPIGIFDSGLGGLTVLKELRRTLPHERFIYLGDTARTPYGSKGQETIRRYSLECAKFLLEREIKLLVVACNTSSSLALDTLSAEVPCPVVGTIEPAVSETLSVPGVRRVGVIGTKATIASRAYEMRLNRCAPEVEVIARPCPLFVPLVEEGLVTGPIVRNVIELYLSSFRNEPVDALILGCTHYPLLSAEVASYLGPATRIVECSKAMALSVASILEQQGLTASSKEKHGESEHYYVTDDVSRFNSLASLFLEHRSVEAVKVEAL